MSASLPDDPAQWPDDPHELLGVPREVGPIDLRRAYTRLIRTYKPEQFPEQFRRIRAAYETALRLAEFLSENAARGFAVEVPLGREVQEVTPELLPAPRPFDPAEDANALWELAAAGHMARAYAGLAALAARRPNEPDLPLRLYWLLSLEPTLDADRDPAEWLTDGLRRANLAGPATELFRRELDERPAEALAASASLATIDAPTDRLAGFLAARTVATVHLGRWDLLRADLDRGRERVRPTDEVSWLRLVLTACDHLAWKVGDAWEANELLAECRRELESLGHLAVRHAQAFDRLEFLLSASVGWGAMRAAAALPLDLLDLLPAAWNRPFPEVQPLVAEVLAKIAAAPTSWLRHFDTIAVRNKATLSYIGHLLAQYQDRLPEPPPAPHAPADLARFVAEFIRDNGQWIYQTLRPRLLTFCLREAVGAELVAAVAPASDPSGPALQQAIIDDWPLRHVCWACRLFWT